MAIGLLAFSQFEFVRAESVSAALDWYHLGFLWPVVLPLLLHFSLIYPKSPTDRISAKLWLALYAPAVFVIGVLLLTPSSLLATPVHVGSFWVIEQSSEASFSNAMVLGLSTLYTFVIVATALVHLFRARTRMDRSQRFVVLLGVVVGLASSVASYAILPGMGISTPDIATYGFGLGCVILGFAVWRYGLFELDLGAAAEQIVQVMPDALLLIGPEYEIIRTTEATCSLLGRSADDLYGSDFVSLFGEAARVSVEQTLRDHPGVPVAGLETQLHRGQDAAIPVMLSCSPVTDKRGNRAGTVCVLRDLRLEKLAEEERRSLEERLRQSEKMEAIGRLAGGVAHDFNNILAGILGYAELIRMDSGDANEKLGEHIGKIVDNSKRAATLVTNLLTFARKNQINLEPVDLNTVVDQVVGLLDHSIDKRISVQRSLSREPAMVLADASQMHNAVLNLAINARDALAGSGNILISTALCRLDASDISARKLEIRPGAFVQLTVEDDGMGISSDEIDHIFDPFFTTKGVGEGTGLGLASVYGAAHGCGGAVSVESEPGRGSVFVMYLPAAGLAEVVRDSDPEFLEPGSANILIIDDEQFVREVTATALERAGHTTHSFGESDEGLDFLAGNPDLINLVILDLNMPGHSGYEVFEQIQRLNSQLPVLISTGMLVEDDGDTSLRDRSAGIIQKPFKVAQLTAIVGDVLGRPVSE